MPYFLAAMTLTAIGAFFFDIRFSSWQFWLIIMPACCYLGVLDARSKIRKNEEKVKRISSD